MKTHLLLNLIKNREKGFALPLAVLTGLILMGTGISMIVRAQGDQSKVIFQKARADSLTGSEAGVTRIQDLLNSVRILATFDSHCTSGDCWQTAQIVASPSTNLQKALNTLDTANSCSNNNNDFANKITAPTEQRRRNPGLKDLTTGQWFDLGNNRYYRLIRYDYQDRPTNKSIGQGIFVLEGLSRKSPITDTNDFNNIALDRDQDDKAASRNRIVITLPINRSYPVAFDSKYRDTVPALWISEGATEDRGQTSQITVDNPSYFYGAVFQGDVVMSDNTAATGFVESTGTLRSNLECHIDENNIQQPTINALNPPYKAQFVETTFPDLPTIPSDVPPSQGDLDITGSETETLTFPRQSGGLITDTPSTVRLPNGQDVQAYKYIINNIDLNDGSTITITPGTRVIFYVKGNISFNGTNSIRHDCTDPDTCQPTNFQIYAYGDRSILGATTPQICLKGNSNLNAFIFAPDYLVGKTGTGNFTGAVWAKSWGKIQNCGSNNGTVAVTQGARWDGLIANLRPAPLASLPQLGNITSWCEEPVDTTNSKCLAP
jgi:hypothetical protein